MTTISLGLVEQNEFFREGLRNILGASNFDVKYAGADYASMAHDGRVYDEVMLALIGTDCDGVALAEAVRGARAAFPQSRIAVMTDRTDPDYIRAAFDAGVDGYLSRDISPPALTGALNMLLSGEKVCPGAVLNRLVRGENGEAIAAGDVAGPSLTAREMQVLRYLAAGETNKQIAKNLSITEATVKVHVKAVLRRLGLSNRTQAAVWAVDQGWFNRSDAA